MPNLGGKFTNKLAQTSATWVNYKGFRQSHAVVFVPHHLDSVKGSSPDLNPLIYLCIFVFVSKNNINSNANKLIDDTKQLETV